MQNNEENNTVFIGESARNIVGRYSDAYIDDMNTAVASSSVTVTPHRTKSTAVGYQTGINIKCKNNTYLGHKTGWGTHTNNNILIGVEIDSTQGNEIKIGDKQEIVTIGVYDLANLLARIKELERLALIPGGAYCQEAEARFYTQANLTKKESGLLKDCDSDEKDE